MSLAVVNSKLAGQCYSVPFSSFDLHYIALVFLLCCRLQ